MTKTTSLLETAEKTLGIQWPYTVADIERAKARLSTRARDKSRSSHSAKLIESAVTQCGTRVRKALTTAGSKPKVRSTRVQRDTGDELGRLFTLMTRSYFQTTTLRKDRIAMSLGVLKLHMPSTEQEIEDARERAAQGIDPNDADRETKLKALAVATEVLVKNLKGKRRPRSAPTQRRGNLAVPEPNGVHSDQSDSETATKKPQPPKSRVRQRRSSAAQPDLLQRIAAAKESAATLVSVENKHSKVRDRHTYPFLDEAYGILRTREQDSVAYETFIKEAGAVAKTGRKPSQHREVINALFTKEQRKCLSPGFLSNWADALSTAEARNVPIGGVSQWLRNAEIVDDRKGALKGFAKVRAIKQFLKRKSERVMEATAEQDQDQQRKVSVQDARAQAAEHPDFTLENNEFLNGLQAEGCTDAVFVASVAARDTHFRLMTKDRGKVETHLFVNEFGKLPRRSRNRRGR